MNKKLILLFTFIIAFTSFTCLKAEMIDYRYSNKGNVKRISLFTNVSFNKQTDLNAKFDNVYFYKDVGKIPCTLALEFVSKLRFKFTWTAITIDGAVFSPLPLIRKEFEQKNKKSVLNRCLYDIDGEILESLLSAKEVSLRIFSLEQPEINWLIPPEILNEWQQIIEN